MRQEIRDRIEVKKGPRGAVISWKPFLGFGTNMEEYIVIA